ncbi:MAG: hypothetical protein AB7T06_48525, partial [Kofleriaceae bacterium]
MDAKLVALLGGFAMLGCGDDTPATHDAAPGADMRPMIDADEGAVPRAEPTACRFEIPAVLGLNAGTDYSCGDLIVYEDREVKGRTIKVHYVKFESAVASANATIYLDGGPGGDGQNIIDYAAYLGA